MTSNPVISLFMDMIDARDPRLVDLDLMELASFSPVDVKEAKRIVVSVDELINQMVRRGHRTYGDARLIVTYMAHTLSITYPNVIVQETAPECVVLGKLQMLADFHNNMLRPFGHNLDVLPVAMARQMLKFKSLLSEV